MIFPSRAFLAASAIAFSISGHAEPVAVADDGHHEALLRGDGHSDVVEVVLDDGVAVDLGVDRGHLLQGVHDRLGEEGHEAELDAVLLHEVLLVPGPQRHHGRHVDLVEGGEERGGLLDRDEALGDALAKRRHRAPRLPRGLRARPRRFPPQPWRRRAPRRGAGAVAAASQHVALRHPAGLPGAGDGGGVDAGLRGDPADGRAIGLRPARPRPAGRGRPTRPEGRIRRPRCRPWPPPGRSSPRSPRRP